MTIKVSHSLLDDPITHERLTTKAIVYSIDDNSNGATRLLYGCIHRSSTEPVWYYRPNGKFMHIYNLDQIPDITVLTEEEEFQLITVWDYGTLKFDETKKMQEHFHSSDVPNIPLDSFRTIQYKRYI